MLPFEDRFTRQRQLREVGIEGQRRLEETVVVLGEGAAERVAGEYLRRAGVRVSFASPDPLERVALGEAPVVGEMHAGPELAEAEQLCSYRGPASYLAGALLALRHVRTVLDLEGAAKP